MQTCGVWSGSEEKLWGFRGWDFTGRRCMTCGTHTAANVTAAFGFNPLVSGSFLKWRDSCECTICSLFRNITPAVSSGPSQRRRRKRLSFSLSLVALNFTFSGGLFWRAGRRAGHAGHGAPLWPWKLVALFWHLSVIIHQLHLPDARLLPIRTASSVCVCVCLCVGVPVCVYIYIKRESNIYESIFFLFCDESYW